MSDSQPAPPAIHSGQELYDAIMSVVDPELTTAELPLLKDKYANETPEQRVARAARYETAFAEYEKKLLQYGEEWSGQFRAYRRTALASLEADAKRGEEGDLSSLESSMASL